MSEPFEGCELIEVGGAPYYIDRDGAVYDEAGDEIFRSSSPLPTDTLCEIIAHGERRFDQGLRMGRRVLQSQIRHLIGAEDSHEHESD